MRHFPSRAALLLAAALLLGGCASSAPPPSPTASPTPSAAPIAAPEPTPTPNPAAERLASMTTEQKVSQLLIAGIAGTEPGEDGALAVETYQVGGVILFSRNAQSAAQLAELTNGLKAMNGDYIPLFFGIDQEGGRVDRMPDELTPTPSAYEVGRAGCGYDYGALLAAECASFGCNVDFAPSLDIWSNPDNTVIGDRALGSDADTVTHQGMEALSGFYSHEGVIPVVKHFPGHGDTETDSHVELPVVTDTLDSLRAGALSPFAAAISGMGTGQPVPAVMVSHILLTAVDETYPSTLSPAVVDGLLRQDMGFDGVVITDGLQMQAMTDTYSSAEIALKAVAAGVDLLLCPSDLESAVDALTQAVGDGTITMERLDESVLRILTLKLGRGLFSEN